MFNLGRWMLYNEVCPRNVAGDEKENAQVENCVPSYIRYFSQDLKDCINLLHIKFTVDFNACRCVWLVLCLLRRIFLTNSWWKLLRQYVNRSDFQGNSQWKSRREKGKIWVRVQDHQCTSHTHMFLHMTVVSICQETFWAFLPEAA